MGEHSRRAALLLRGQHERPGVPARLPRGDRAHAPPDLEHEVLVLDNASDDGSAEAVRELDRDIRLIALDRREGKAANDSRLIEEARGEFCLLLNEDSELQPGAVPALLGALRSDRERRGRRGPAALARWRTRSPAPGACPALETALAGALFLHRRFTVESGGDATRPVGWVQSSAMLVRREAALAGRRLRSGFLRLLRRDRLLQAPLGRGWRILHVPSARAIHHDQMAQDAAGAERRIVEYHRNRDLYLRKHLGSRSSVSAAPGARLALPAARARCAGSPGPLPASLLAARPSGADAGRGRGHPRGRGGIQPPHRVVDVRILEVTQMWPSPENPDLGSFLVPLTREIEALGHEVEVASISQRGGSPIEVRLRWSARPGPRPGASAPMSSSPISSSPPGPPGRSPPEPQGLRWS